MKAVLLVLLVAVLGCVSAKSVAWTGNAGNNLWHFATNWDGNVVPTKDDDVSITAVGGSSVTISQPAVANSVTIGRGIYHQTLTLLSSLAVGSGGITIAAKSVLVLSGNNDLPLSSVGDVTATAGSSIVFNSGDITGPGQYNIEFGAEIDFAGSALKMLEAVDVVIHGTATIQPTTIQLAKGATLTNGGDLTAVGQINIFSTDNSKASFYSYGNFSYTGSNPTAPLTFNVATYFAADLDIAAGTVAIQAYFHSAAAINLPAGTALNILSGPEDKNFKTITGAGSLNVAGTAEVSNALTVSWITISDGGSLTLNTTSSTKSLSVGGKLIISRGANLTATDVSLTAGTITGEGQLFASGNFEIAVSTSGNANSFISTKVNVAGTGFVTGSASVLFADGGNLNIQKGATFTITSTTSFTRQTGDPVVTSNGEFTIRLPVGSTFRSSVDFVGTGNFSVSSGDITIEANKFNASLVNLGNNAILRLLNTQITTGTVSGAGSLNVTAAPDTVAVLGDVALTYFGVASGNVRVKSLKLSTLEIFNGALAVGSGSTNTANTFNFYGGTLSGNAKLVSSSLNIGGNIPQTIDTVVINTNRFTLRAGTPQGTLMTSNNAQIISAPSSH